MPVAFLTDVRLRFALSLVSPPGLQSHIATHVAAFAEALRIFQRQQVGERDQRSPLSSPAPAALLADNFPWRLHDLLVVFVTPLSLSGRRRCCSTSGGAKC